VSDWRSYCISHSTCAQCCGVCTTAEVYQTYKSLRLRRATYGTLVKHRIHLFTRRQSARLWLIHKLCCPALIKLFMFRGLSQQTSVFISLSVHACRQAPEFQLVVEPSAWGRTAEGLQGPLLRLHTPTAAATRLDLPAGRHLARLLTDNHGLHALDLRCNTPFQLEDLNKVWNRTGVGVLPTFCCYVGVCCLFSTDLGSLKPCSVPA